MLWEQQSVLSKLGTSVEAAHVRAKMQSMSLISDMQAFKVIFSLYTMYMYVYMYVCVYVCMYVCMYVRMYVCTYVCM